MLPGTAAGNLNDGLKMNYMRFPTVKTNTVPRHLFRAILRSAFEATLALCVSLPVRAEPKIAVSIYPVFDWVKNIAGDSAYVMLIIPPGANPHTFEPVPSVVTDIQKMQLFIGVHPDLDGWIRRFFPKNRPVRFLATEDTHFGEEDQGITDNPHIWLSVRNAMQCVGDITTWLSGADRKNSAYYESNRDRYLSELEALDQSIQDLFKDVENRQFIQWHPAWNYFAGDYNLTIIGTVEHGHGDQPSIRDMQHLIEKASSAGIKAVVMGLNQNSRSAEALVHAIKGRLIILDTIGDPEQKDRATFLNLMRYNAVTLKKGLAETAGE